MVDLGQMHLINSVLIVSIDNTLEGISLFMTSQENATSDWVNKSPAGDEGWREIDYNRSQLTGALPILTSSETATGLAILRRRRLIIEELYVFGFVLSAMECELPSYYSGSRINRTVKYNESVEVQCYRQADNVSYLSYCIDGTLEHGGWSPPIIRCDSFQCSTDEMQKTWLSLDRRAELSEVHYKETFKVKCTEGFVGDDVEYACDWIEDRFSVSAMNESFTQLCQAIGCELPPTNNSGIFALVNDPHYSYSCPSNTCAVGQFAELSCPTLGRYRTEHECIKGQSGQGYWLPPVSCEFGLDKNDTFCDSQTWILTRGNCIVSTYNDTRVDHASDVYYSLAGKLKHTIACESGYFIHPFQPIQQLSLTLGSVEIDIYSVARLQCFAGCSQDALLDEAVQVLPTKAYYEPFETVSVITEMNDTIEVTTLQCSVVLGNEKLTLPYFNWTLSSSVMKYRRAETPTEGQTKTTATQKIETSDQLDTLSSYHISPTLFQTSLADDMTTELSSDFYPSSSTSTDSSKTFNKTSSIFGEKETSTFSLLDESTKETGTVQAKSKTSNTISTNNLEQTSDQSFTLSTASTDIVSSFKSKSNSVHQFASTFESTMGDEEITSKSLTDDLTYSTKRQMSISQMVTSPSLGENGITTSTLLANSMSILQSIGNTQPTKSTNIGDFSTQRRDRSDIFSEVGITDISPETIIDETPLPESSSSLYFTEQTSLRSSEFTDSSTLTEGFNLSSITESATLSSDSSATHMSPNFTLLKDGDKTSALFSDTGSESSFSTDTSFGNQANSKETVLTGTSTVTFSNIDAKKSTTLSDSLEKLTTLSKKTDEMMTADSLASKTQGADKTDSLARTTEADTSMATESHSPETMKSSKFGTDTDNFTSITGTSASLVSFQDTLVSQEITSTERLVDKITEHTQTEMTSSPIVTSTSKKTGTVMTAFSMTSETQGAGKTDSLAKTTEVGTSMASESYSPETMKSSKFGTEADNLTSATHTSAALVSSQDTLASQEITSTERLIDKITEHTDGESSFSHDTSFRNQANSKGVAITGTSPTITFSNIDSKKSTTLTDLSEKLTILSKKTDAMVTVDSITSDTRSADKTDSLSRTAEAGTSMAMESNSPEIIESSKFGTDTDNLTSATRTSAALVLSQDTLVSEEIINTQRLVGKSTEHTQTGMTSSLMATSTNLFFKRSSISAKSSEENTNSQVRTETGTTVKTVSTNSVTPPNYQTDAKHKVTALEDISSIGTEFFLSELPKSTEQKTTNIETFSSSANSIVSSTDAASAPSQDSLIPESMTNFVMENTALSGTTTFSTTAYSDKAGSPISTQSSANAAFQISTEGETMMNPTSINLETSSVSQTGRLPKSSNLEASTSVDTEPSMSGITSSSDFTANAGTFASVSDVGRVSTSTTSLPSHSTSASQIITNTKGLFNPSTTNYVTKGTAISTKATMTDIDAQSLPFTSPLFNNSTTVKTKTQTDDLAETPSTSSKTPQNNRNPASPTEYTTETITDNTIAKSSLVDKTKGTPSIETTIMVDRPAESSLDLTSSDVSKTTHSILPQSTVSFQTPINTQELENGGTTHSVVSSSDASNPIPESTVTGARNSNFVSVNITSNFDSTTDSNTQLQSSTTHSKDETKMMLDMISTETLTQTIAATITDARHSNFSSSTSKTTGYVDDTTGSDIQLKSSTTYLGDGTEMVFDTTSTNILTQDVAGATTSDARHPSFSSSTLNMTRDVEAATDHTIQFKSSTSQLWEETEVVFDTTSTNILTQDVAVATTSDAGHPSFSSSTVNMTRDVEAATDRTIQLKSSTSQLRDETEMALDTTSTDTLTQNIEQTTSSSVITATETVTNRSSKEFLHSKCTESGISSTYVAQTSDLAGANSASSLASANRSTTSAASLEQSIEDLFSRQSTSQAADRTDIHITQEDRLATEILQTSFIQNSEKTDQYRELNSKSAYSTDNQEAAITRLVIPTLKDTASSMYSTDLFASQLTESDNRIVSETATNFQVSDTDMYTFSILASVSSGSPAKAGTKPTETTENAYKTSSMETLPRPTEMHSFSSNNLQSSSNSDLDYHSHTLVTTYNADQSKTTPTKVTDFSDDNFSESLESTEWAEETTARRRPTTIEDFSTMENKQTTQTAKTTQTTVKNRETAQTTQAVPELSLVTKMSEGKPTEVEKSTKPTHNVSVLETVTSSTTSKSSKQITTTTDKPVTTSVNKPSIKSVSQPLTKSVEQLLTKSVEQPSTKSVEQPLTKSVEQPSTKSVQQPLTKSVEQPSTKSVQQPLTKSVEQPVTKSVEQPPTKSVEQPKTTSVEQPLTKALTTQYTSKTTLKLAQTRTKQLTSTSFTVGSTNISVADVTFVAGANQSGSKIKATLLHTLVLVAGLLLL